MPRLARIDACLPAPEVQLTRPPRLKPCDAGLVADGPPDPPAVRRAGVNPVTVNLSY
jgi:hypothetical protein